MAADADLGLDSPQGERESVRRLLRLLATSGAALMFIVIVASAYMRLSQAGLSCADWPACYGRADAHAAAAAGMGGARIVHRIAASAVGIVLLAALLVGIAQHPRPKRQVALIVAALVIALFLAGLGSAIPASTAALPSLRVTLANLGGGFALLALLWWLRLSTLQAALPEKQAPSLKLVAALALLAVIAQIALGALVSAKFAALACPAFPGCGADSPQGALLESFDLTRDPSFGANGEMLRPDSLAALHWAHRAGALVSVALGAAVALWLLRAGGHARRIGFVVIVLLVAQLSLGAAAVLANFPLALVVAHNACAALLLLALISANRVLYVGVRKE